MNMNRNSVDTPTYRFTGKPVSQTTGLYYYGSRWQTPSGTLADYYAGTLRIASVFGSTINAYYTDRLGSTRLVTDSNENSL